MEFWFGAVESLAMNFNFWQGKRVFLTGHTGFKGSWLSIWLKSLGAEVTGYSLKPNTKLNLFEEAKLDKSMISIIGNILDLENLQKSIKNANPDIVIHMAAQALVQNSYKNPVETFSTNVMGTVNLLEAVRNSNGIKVVIIITSDKCYENKEWNWGYRENEPLGGYDPYSSSKACAEIITAAYRTSYFNENQYNNHGLALATARAGNVIGGGDWAENRLIPDILKAFEKEEQVRIRKPKAIRPWQHVLEPLRGYLILAEHLFHSGTNYAEAWNFGPDEKDVKSVLWITENMAKMWDKKIKWKIDEEEDYHEANFLKLDSSKARVKLNWKPILEVKDSLQLVIDWSKKRKLNNNVFDLTLEQIKNYELLIIKQLN